MCKFPYSKIILLILFILSKDHAFAQHKNIQLLNTSSGLPLFNVRSIVQDNKGYMWFGTQNCLVRFDGYEYKAITRELAALTSSKISLLEYNKRKNELWIATEK